MFFYYPQNFARFSFFQCKASFWLYSIPANDFYHIVLKKVNKTCYKKLQDVGEGLFSLNQDGKIGAYKTSDLTLNFLDPALVITNSYQLMLIYSKMNHMCPLEEIGENITWNVFLLDRVLTKLCLYKSLLFPVSDLCCRFTIWSYD